MHKRNETGHIHCAMLWVKRSFTFSSLSFLIIATRLASETCAAPECVADTVAVVDDSDDDKKRVVGTVSESLCTLRGEYEGGGVWWLMGDWGLGDLTSTCKGLEVSENIL